MPVQTPKTRPVKLAEKRKRRQDDLVEATIYAIAQHGIAGASVERISAAAGVSRGLMRHYFGSKSSLLVAAFQRLSDEFRATLSRGAGRAGRDAMLRLDGSIEAVFRKPHLDIERLRAWFGFWHASPSDPALGAVNESVTEQHRAFVTGLLSQAARERGVSLDVARAGLGLSMLMDGAFLALAEASSSMTPGDAEAVCKLYVRMALRSSE